MLRNVIESEDDVLVFFHDDTDEDEIEEILAGLERIDDDLDKEEVEFVRCSDDDIIDEFGLSMLPSLVYFEAGIPTVYESGDLKNHAAILGWVTTELRRTTIRYIKKFNFNNDYFLKHFNKANNVNYNLKLQLSF